jgi:hypothetical protein
MAHFKANTIYFRSILLNLPYNQPERRRDSSKSHLFVFLHAIIVLCANLCRDLEFSKSWNNKSSNPNFDRSNHRPWWVFELPTYVWRRELALFLFKPRTRMLQTCSAEIAMVGEK